MFVSCLSIFIIICNFNLANITFYEQNRANAHAWKWAGALIGRKSWVLCFKFCFNPSTHHWLLLHKIFHGKFLGRVQCLRNQLAIWQTRIYLSTKVLCDSNGEILKNWEGFHVIRNRSHFTMLIRREVYIFILPFRKAEAIIYIFHSPPNLFCFNSIMSLEIK